MRVSPCLYGKRRRSIRIVYLSRLAINLADGDCFGHG